MKKFNERGFCRKIDLANGLVIPGLYMDGVVFYIDGSYEFIGADHHPVEIWPASNFYKDAIALHNRWSNCPQIEPDDLMFAEKISRNLNIS